MTASAHTVEPKIIALTETLINLMAATDGVTFNHVQTQFLDLIAKEHITMSSEEVRRNVGKVADGASRKCGNKDGKDIMKAYKVR